jgi:putative redox protein
VTAPAPAKKPAKPSLIHVNWIGGHRFDAVPRRYKHITLNFRIGGKGIEKEQTLRAIELSATKYCSVRETIRSDVQVDWTVELEEESSGTH